MAKKTVRDRFGKSHRIPDPITREWMLELLPYVVSASGKNQAEIARELELRESNVSAAMRNMDPRYDYLRMRIIRGIGGIPLERVMVYRIQKEGDPPAAEPEAGAP